MKWQKLYTVAPVAVAQLVRELRIRWGAEKGMGSVHGFIREVIICLLRLFDMRIRLLSLTVVVLTSTGPTYADSAPSPCREDFDISDWPNSVTEFKLTDARRKEGFGNLMERILHGEAIAEEQLQVSPTWHEYTLWMLLNAVYARHGRPFETNLLNQFFYTSWCREDPQCSMLPLHKAKHYLEDELSKNDKATVVMLRSQLKKQCGY